MPGVDPRSHSETRRINLQPSLLHDVCLRRWSGYLGLLLFDVIICLLALFGLIRNSKGTLIG